MLLDFTGSVQHVDPVGEMCAGFHRRFLWPHSSSASRFTAGAFAFFILSQSGDRPERYGESLRFETITFKAELARVSKNSFAVALHVLVKSDARPGLSQDHSQCFLAAVEWITPQIVAVQFDQVEGV